MPIVASPTRRHVFDRHPPRCLALRRAASRLRPRIMHACRCILEQEHGVAVTPRRRLGNRHPCRRTALLSHNRLHSSALRAVHNRPLRWSATFAAALPTFLHPCAPVESS
jgi:hypothetical protein